MQLDMLMLCTNTSGLDIYPNTIAACDLIYTLSLPDKTICEQ